MIENENKQVLNQKLNNPRIYQGFFTLKQNTMNNRQAEIIARLVDIVSDRELPLSTDFLSKESKVMNCEDMKTTTMEPELNKYLYNHTTLLQQ